MKSLFLVLATVSVFSSVSFASQRDQVEISDLATQVKLAARTTVASDSDLYEAKTKLREVLDLLNNSNSGGGPSGECFDYAYEKYYKTQNSSDATNSALEACRKIADLEVAKFIYDKVYAMKNSKDSMDEAASKATYALSGKLDMLQFAYDKYYKTMNSVDALDNAVTQIGTVRSGSLACLDKLYANYYKTQNSKDAMDNAVKACR